MCTSASCVAPSNKLFTLRLLSVRFMDVRSMCRYLGNRHTSRDVATDLLPRTNHILEFSATHATRASTQCHLIAHWLRVSYLSLNSLTSLLISFLSNESEPSAYVPNKLRILGTVTGGLAHLRVCRGAVTCLVIATPHSQRDIYLVFQNGCY